MPIQSTDTEPQSATTDAVVVGIFSDEAPSGAAAAIDAATGGAIAKLIEAKEIEGKASQTLPLHHPAGVASSGRAGASARRTIGAVSVSSHSSTCPSLVRRQMSRP